MTLKTDRQACANPEECCRELSRVWAALGIETYNGKSASENVAELLNNARNANDVTDKVAFHNPDDERLPIIKCVCGAEFGVWAQTISIYENPEPMPCCGARLYFNNQVQVFIYPDASTGDSEGPRIPIRPGQAEGHDSNVELPSAGRSASGPDCNCEIRRFGE